MGQHDPLQRPYPLEKITLPIRALQLVRPGFPLEYVIFWAAVHTELGTRFRSNQVYEVGVILGLSRKQVENRIRAACVAPALIQWVAGESKYEFIHTFT